MANAANLRKITVKIANGGTNSEAANLTRGLLVGIRFPSTMTSTTFKLQNCPDTSQEVTTLSFRDCLNTSNADILSSLAISTTKDILFDTAQTAGLGTIRVVVGSAEGAERSIELFFKEAQ